MSGAQWNRPPGEYDQNEAQRTMQLLDDSKRAEEMRSDLGLDDAGSDDGSAASGEDDLDLAAGAGELGTGSKRLVDVQMQLNEAEIRAKKFEERARKLETKYKEFKRTAKVSMKAKDKDLKRLRKEFAAREKELSMEIDQSDEVVNHLHARIDVLEATARGKEDPDKLRELIERQKNVNSLLERVKIVEGEKADLKRALKKRIDERDHLVEKYKKLKRKFGEAAATPASARANGKGFTFAASGATGKTADKTVVVSPESQAAVASALESRAQRIREMDGKIRDNQQKNAALEAQLGVEKKNHEKTKDILERYKKKAGDKVKQAAEKIQLLKQRDRSLCAKVKELVADKKKLRAKVEAAQGQASADDLKKAEERAKKAEGLVIDAEQRASDAEQRAAEADSRSTAATADVRALETNLDAISRSVQSSVNKRKLSLERARSACGSLSSAARKVKKVVRSIPGIIGDLEPMILRELKKMADRAAGESAKLLKNYKKEVKLRRKYFNMLQELKGNIRVYCRVRPLIGRDKGSDINVRFPSDPDDMSMKIYNEDGRPQSYEFEQIFRLDSTQEKIFNEVKGLTRSVTDGYNVCIFAYGQTGSGKTYTMQGPDSDPGIYYRSVSHLFDIIKERKTSEFRVRLSLLEIYNNNIQDLLVSKSESKKLGLPVMGPHGTEVPGLVIRDITGLVDVKKAMRQGMKNRSVAATKMNQDSSRSHSILSLYVESYDKVSRQHMYGKLHLIDLAGSERLSRSEATGQARLEAQQINKSLSALGNCIAARANKNSHVPYRDSMLTRLLQDSLEKNSKTLMFVQISPVMSDYSESTNSLKFAARVKEVELGKATKNKRKKGRS